MSEEDEVVKKAKRTSRVEADTIIEDLPPAMARGFVYCLIVSLVLSVIWATYSKVDVVAECTGKVAPLGELIRIDPPFAGKLASIRVRVGDHVEKGDLLFQIDPIDVAARNEKATAELLAENKNLMVLIDALNQLTEVLDFPQQSLRKGISSLSSQEAASAISEISRTYLDLLEVQALSGDIVAAAILNTKEAKFKKEASKANLLAIEAIVKGEEAELALSEEELRSGELSVARGNEQINLQRGQLKRERSRYEQINKEAKIYEDLATAGVVSKLQAAERRREADAIKGELTRIKSSIKQSILENKQNIGALEQAHSSVVRQESSLDRAKQDLIKAKAESKASKNQLARRLSVAIEEHERAKSLANQVANRIQVEIEVKSTRMRSLEAETKYSAQLLQRTDVKAPVAGHITIATSHHPGEYVQQDQPVLILAPDSAQLIADIRVKNKDYGRIVEGQGVKFKVESFPFQIYGIQKGKVLHKFPDANPKTNEFRVLCTFDTVYIEGKNGPEPLQIGMTLGADIKIDKRRVIDYLIEPILRLSDKFAGSAG